MVCPPPFKGYTRRRRLPDTRPVPTGEDAMRWLRAFLVVACVGLVSACKTITGGPLVRPGEPTGVLEISNGSRHTLTAAVQTDCSAMSHRLNRLPSGVTIPPGRSHRLTVSAGCRDVDTGLASGTMLHEACFRTRVPPGRLTRHHVRGRPCDRASKTGAGDVSGARLVLRIGSDVIRRLRLTAPCGGLPPHPCPAPGSRPQSPQHRR